MPARRTTISVPWPCRPVAARKPRVNPPVSGVEAEQLAAGPQSKAAAKSRQQPPVRVHLLHEQGSPASGGPVARHTASSVASWRGLRISPCRATEGQAGLIRSTSTFSLLMQMSHCAFSRSAACPCRPICILLIHTSCNLALAAQSGKAGPPAAAKAGGGVAGRPAGWPAELQVLRIGCVKRSSSEKK